MKTVNISELSIVDFNVNNIVAINQKWNNVKYAYLKTPRQDNGFNLITNGCIEYTDADGNSVKAFKGDITYIPKGKYYDTKFSSENGSYTTCILINFLITDSDNKPIILSDNIINLGNTNDTSVEKYFRTIAGAYRTSTDKLKVKTLFLELMQKIISVYNSHNNDINNMEKCVEYINKNFIENISISTLAQMCCISETTFRKRFKEIYKIPPIKYINKKKIEFACQMLLSSDIKINEISDFLNFYDTSYFYKTFVEFEKTTPAQYRNEYRNK